MVQLRKLIFLWAAGALSPAFAQTAKKGVIFTNSAVLSPFSGKASWAYNYATSPGGSVPAGIEYVPMFISPQAAQAGPAAVESAKNLLGYNEPDNPEAAGGQALDPGTAAGLWQQQFNPLSSIVRLGSPAITNDNSPSGPAGFASGLTWLQQFVAAGGGNLHIDFVCLHWYGASGQSAATQASELIAYLNQAQQEITQIFGQPLPIWLTEFSPLPTADQNAQLSIDFLNAVLPQLDANSRIERYSFFQGSDLESGGSLNSVGQAYING